MGGNSGQAEKGVRVNTIKVYCMNVRKYHNEVHIKEI
jgi:hypothetical protein